MTSDDGLAALGAGLRPLEGGWSGETFLAEAAGERSVVRVYGARGRGPEAPEVDAAVLRLVRGLVPVPEVLEVRRGSGEAPGLLVTAYVEGERGDLVLPGLDAAGLALLGERVGRVAADLAGMPQLQPGLFADGGLRVRPFGLDLPAYVEEQRPRLTGWDPQLLGRLGGLAEDAQDLLDTVRRTCLVHSDLNPKNLLVDPATLRLTAVLDWEYAHAGHPATDLGNLVRWEREPAWVEAVVGQWWERHGERDGLTPDEALTLARAADLWALVDLAARAGQNPVADRAAEHLHEVAATGDVHALPGWTPRGTRR